MNQILYVKPKLINQKNLKLIKAFKFQFSISLIILLFLFVYLIFSFYNIKSEENFSHFFVDNFEISNLYSNNYYLQNSNDNSLIIGIIEIEKIGIKYSILSYTTDDLLKISPCRFYGPLPNKIGNLCIAGHNYNDSRFFSKLYTLDINDIIKIYDLSNNLVKYYIYNKYEAYENDISCTEQNTNGKREITLITCNNLNNKRLVIKAKEWKL